MSKPMLCCIPMPLPGLEGMLLFNRINITEFLDWYNDICKEHFVDSDNKLSKLLQYCMLNIRDAIKLIKE